MWYVMFDIFFRPQIVAELEVCPAYPRDSLIPATYTIAILASHPWTTRLVETSKRGGVLYDNSYYHRAEAWDADREVVVFVCLSIRSPCVNTGITAWPCS